MSYLHKYNNYDEYVNIQTKGNYDKIDNIWVNDTTIEKISEYMKFKTNIYSILCHGTRNGKELQYFQKYLKPINIIGTEISTSAIKFNNTIQWDFHNTKPEWISFFDIIYSNSLDHSYKPIDCIQHWLSCLNDNGYLFIEWTLGHNYDKTTELDPFGATINVMENILVSEKLNLCDKILIDEFTTIFILKKISKEHIIEDLDFSTCQTNNITKLSNISYIKPKETNHAVYFTEKNQIVSHTTNNSYGNTLLAKYKIGNVIKLKKDEHIVEFNIVNKTEKDGKVVLYFNNELTNDLLENRRNWVIIK